MDESQAVQTASEGQSCRQCGKPLPKRPSAKEHHFCGPKCRAAWHRTEKQRALNRALEHVRTADTRLLSMLDDTPWLAVPAKGRGDDRRAFDEARLALARAAADLVSAGAEPS
jgi:hypothetical protein